MRELEKFLNDLSAHFLLLQSKDSYSTQHYPNSQLARHTGFSGSAGEALLSKSGKIYLFVDPRYHIQADSQAKKGVEVVKLEMSQSYIDSLKKILPKDAVLAVSAYHTSVSTFEKLSKCFNVKKANYPDIIEEEGQKESFELKEEFSGESSASKISKIQTFIKEQGADGYLVSNLEDIAYLSNRRSFEIPYSSTFKAKVYIDENSMKTLPTKMGNKVIINPQNTSVADATLIKKPIFIEENPIAKLASIKNEAEIKHLKTCFKNLDDALCAFKEQVKAGMSEYELKELVEKEILSKGACALSFKTILAIGENSSSIHYCASDKNKRLQKGDMLLLDCGSYCEGGLATDITRTFVCEEPSQEQKTVYTRVLQAFLRSYNSELSSGYELDTLARTFLKENSPKGFHFPHALGHGVGIAVHQAPPSISPSDKNKEKLLSGNVFTIEPGLYCEGKFGVRLENTIYINEQGKKVSFSKFPFEQKLIDFNLLNEDETKWLTSWL